MALQAAEMQRKKQVFMIAGRKTDKCLPENVYTENHISSALPLLCNRGRRFIAGASYAYLEILSCNILCYILEGLIFRKSFEYKSLYKFRPM